MEGYQDNIYTISSSINRMYNSVSKQNMFWAAVDFEMQEDHVWIESLSTIMLFLLIQP